MEEAIEDGETAAGPEPEALVAEEEAAPEAPETEPAPEEEGPPEEPKEPKRWKREALLLLRDLGIAFLIVLIIVGIITAYAQVWPPMVVVESESMQHSSSESFIGVIDTGDLVLVQRAPERGDLITYLQGRASGHSTYGDFGDVVVYHKDGDTGRTPIIHRLFTYMVWNESAGGFDLPDLDRKYWMDRLGTLWGGTNRDANGTTPVTSPYGLNDMVWFTDFGFTDANLSLRFDAYKAEQTSGYVTVGDNNVQFLGGHPFGPWDTPLVRQEYIVGKARGELPWFGLIKLTLSGQIPWGAPCEDRGGACAPANSWSALTVSLVLMFALPIGADLGLSYWSKRKARREEAPFDEEE